MQINEKGTLTYVTIGETKYQIGPEENGGMMIRLVETPYGSARMAITASASNTIHVRPDVSN